MTSLALEAASRQHLRGEVNFCSFDRNVAGHGGFLCA
jgi:hypothetical protein